MVKWKLRAREIEELRAKYKNNRSYLTIPDYKIEQNVSPTSNYIGNTGRAKPFVPGKKKFLVGNFHKQGPMLVLRSELEWAGGKKS
jgi:hypothetical protein